MAIERFTLDIARFADKAKGKMREFCIEFIQDLNEEIVMATPAKTGFLRGSWHAAISEPLIEPYPSPLPKDGSEVAAVGGAAIAQMNLVTVDMELGKIFYIMNGANYASFVEYGTARMSPRAFVRGTLVRAPAIAEATAARVGAT